MPSAKPFNGLWLLLALASSPAMAQEPLLPYREYAKRTDAAQKVGPLTDAAFGAQTNLYSGGTEFTATDVSLPGNNALPVAVSRSTQIDDRTGVLRPNLGGFADWDLDLPYIEATVPWYVGWKVGSGAGTLARCSAGQAPTMSGFWDVNKVWSGYNLHLPGRGSETLLLNDRGVSPVPVVPQPSAGGPYPWLTKSGLRIKCLTSLASGAGEGFQAITSDGTKYWFNWMVTKEAPKLQDPILINDPNNPLRRARVYLLATRIEDRHGNWVTYTYAAHKLTQINSSDARQITVNWTGEKITTAVAAGKTWTYQYATSPAGVQPDGKALSKVILPDASEWVYSATGSLVQPETWTPPVEGVSGTCDNFQIPEQVFGYTIKHPAGASSTFSFQGKRHYRTRVPYACNTFASPPSEELMVPNYFDVIALVSKTLTGPGLTAQTWTYDYGQNNSSSFCYTHPTTYVYTCPAPRDACVPGIPCAPEADARYVTVSESSGRVKRFTFGTGFDTNDGRLLADEVLSAGAVVKREESVFMTDAEAAGQPFSPSLGTNLVPWQPLSTLVRPVRESTVTQQGVTFESYTNAYDQHARPTSIRQRSREGAVVRDTRTELRAYFDHLPTWTVGQLKSRGYQGQPPNLFDIVFDGTSALPVSLSVNGLATETYTYNADATLATITDARNFTTGLSNWYRGIPTAVAFPDASSAAATVDSYGNVTSVTDALGSVTSYAHDALGRVSQITYPTEAGVPWNAKNIAFVRVASAEYGIASGHWRQTVSQGNYRKVTYFDGLWRPVLEHEYDTANLTGTQRFNARKFDSDGQVTFAGYPRSTASSVASFTTGVTTTYDVLGRPTLARQSSELGFLDTAYAYEAGFETRVTNPLGFATTTNYQTFDQPSTEAPILIEAPLTQTTTIARDLFGKPTVINRSGSWSGGAQSLSRQYVYDAHRRLCKTVSPEEGAIHFEHDAASNVIRTADGDATYTGGTCDAANIALAQKVVRTFDPMNRVTTVTYPDGINNASYSYFPDGALQSLTSNGSVWTYQYNKRRMLTRENLNFYSDYAHDYTYDANGSLASVAGPIVTVAYAPNALGQPTQAGSYATGVQYFPNGAVKQFTYGNGIVHTLTQSVRQLPDVSKDAFGTNRVFEVNLDFDRNGNLLSSTDLAHANRNRTMTYDGLDRLLTATAPGLWGTASYTYDVLDNLRTNTLGTASYTYAYDANNRLDVISRAGNSDWGYSTDLRGNVTSDGRNSYTFTRANRLGGVAGKETYQYDGHGRRTVVWRQNGTGMVPVYGLDGTLRYAADNQKGGGTSYLYLGDDPVAEVFWNWTSGVQSTVYTHTDALGSIVRRTDATETWLTPTSTRLTDCPSTAPWMGRGSPGM